MCSWLEIVAPVLPVAAGGRQASPLPGQRGETLSMESPNTASRFAPSRMYTRSLPVLFPLLKNAASLLLFRFKIT